MVAEADEGTWRIVNQDGRVVRVVDGVRLAYRPADGDRWVRVELRDGAGRYAWSRPFWIGFDEAR